MTTPFKSGAEFLVNTTVTNNQDQPTIAGFADGRFVVAWRDGDSVTGTNIRAQVFNADGSASGGEFPVHSAVTKTSGHGLPSITVLADGRFVVAWSDFSNASSFDIRAQMFNTDGSAFGAEFLVNTTVTNDQTDPTITALADGRFVVAWSDFSNSSSLDIRAQVFNADGSAFGAEFLVNTTVSNNQSKPTITGLADGRFVVAWDDINNGSTFDIRAQVYNADGSRSGTEFLANTTVVSQQDSPTIAALADGRFVMAWNDQSLGLDYNIRGQVFNADGSVSGAEFLVNTKVANDQSHAMITALADGRFVVVWHDQTRNRINAQVFNADGSTSGAQFLVSTTQASSQNDPTITALADGRFVVAWTDVSQTGGDTSGTAVRAQIFDPREAAVSLNGTLAADSFVGTIFADRLGGFFADDTLAGGAGDDLLYGGVGDDDLGGSAGNDQVFGEDGNDNLAGGNGSDGLDGGAGNDTLNGGFGADVARGGAGNDIFFVDLAADLVIEAAGAGGGVDRVQSAVISLDLGNYANVENGNVTGTLALNLTGSGGNNVLTGSVAGNRLLGLGGNDRMTGNGGTDTLDGGIGLDTLQGGTGQDLLIGGSSGGRVRVRHHGRGGQGGAARPDHRFSGRGG